MTDEAKPVEDDVVTEEEVAALMADDPSAQAPPEHVPIPFRKMVVGVTNAGLISLIHNDLSVLEMAELGRQLTETARIAMTQQSAAYTKAVADGNA